MLLGVRIAGVLVGLATGLNVLLGYMQTPEFVVPDYIIAVALIVAALLPSRAWARRGLFAGNAYALGVFSVALARRMQPDGVFNPGLVVIMLVVAASLCLLWMEKGDSA